MRQLFLLAIVAGTSLTAGRAASAGMVFLSAERFGYTGTWQRYDSLADAQARTNATETGVLPQRDLSIYVSEGMTGSAPEFEIMTRWWGPDPGNPNGANEGFFQYYDRGGNTLTSMDTYWNGALTSFTLKASASGADSARFGERAGGTTRDTESFFHDLQICLTIDGLAGNYNSVTGQYEGTDTSAATIDGTITGIVENVGPDCSRHGFYVFQLDLNNVSWAYDNCRVSDGELQAFTGASAPEPASAALFLGGLVTTGIFWRRRKAV